METGNPFLVEVLGLAAGVCLIMAFLPQAVKIIKTRSAGDLSLSVFLLQSVGVVMWIVYGWLSKSLALVVTNSLCLSIYLVLIVLIIRYRKAKR